VEAKHAVAATALILSVVVAGVFFGRSAPEPAPGPLAPIALPSVEPTPDEPLEPTRPPAPEDDGAGWTCSSLPGPQRWEDRQLRLVLASTAQYDPLFGRDDFEMGGAECAAKRERIAWMGR